jgi:hypothetical protein
MDRLISLATCVYCPCALVVFAALRSVAAPAVALRWFPLTPCDLLAQGMLSMLHTASVCAAFFAATLIPSLAVCDEIAVHVAALAVAYFVFDFAFICARDPRRQWPYLAHHAVALLLLARYADGGLGPTWAARHYFLTLELSNALLVLYGFARRNPGTSPVAAEVLIGPLALTYVPLRTLHVGALTAVMAAHQLLQQQRSQHERAGTVVALLTVWGLSLAFSSRMLARAGAAARCTDLWGMALRGHGILLAYVVVGTPTTRIAAIAFACVYAFAHACW